MAIQPRHIVSYPTNTAQDLLDQLTVMASSDGGNAFLSEMGADPHGLDYRAVTIDIPRQEWRRVQRKLFAAGWRNYGDDGMIHELPGPCYLVAKAVF